MSKFSHHIRSITAQGERFVVRAGSLPSPLAVLLGTNGCGKTTLLRAIAVAHRAANPRSLAGRPRPAAEAVWSAFSTLGKHVTEVEIEFADGALFSVKVSNCTIAADAPKTRRQILAVLSSNAGEHLWQATYPEPGRDESSSDEGSLESESHHGEPADTESSALERYFGSNAELIQTSRLDVSVPPREETIRKYEGVVFSKRVGSSTDRVRSFLEAVSGEPQHPHRHPRVQVLAAQIGLEAERLERMHSDESLRRDSRTVASALRSDARPADPEGLTSQVYALEEQLQSTLSGIGLGDVPRFVDISLQRALIERPQQSTAYFQHSLDSLERLRRELRPLSIFIEQVNRVLRGCRLRIGTRSELIPHKIRLPPEQQRLLVVQFGSDEALHPLTALSSGQQHMLVLLSRVWLGDLTQKADARAGNRLLLIDEPEISLHLAWHTEIAQQLKRLADETNSQVIIATHSNFISGSLPNSSIVEM